MMRRLVMRLCHALVLFVSMCSCGGNVATSAAGDASDVDASSDPVAAYCERLDECFASSFALVYGSGGVPLCVRRMRAGLPPATCSSAQRNVCELDARTFTCCKSIDGCALPRSCDGC